MIESIITQTDEHDQTTDYPRLSSLVYPIDLTKILYVIILMYLCKNVRMTVWRLSRSGAKCRYRIIKSFHKIAKGSMNPLTLGTTTIFVGIPYL